MYVRNWIPFAVQRGAGAASVLLPLLLLLPIRSVQFP